jgi:hypothetical protein
MTQKMASLPLVFTESGWAFEMTIIGLYFSIWFEVVTAVNMKIIVLLDMTLCGLSQICVPENSNLYKLYIF